MRLRSLYWVKYHLNYLRIWRDSVEKVAKAVKDLEPLAEVYVVGGVAEGRLTVLSDVDVVIVVDKDFNASDVNMLRRSVYVRAVDLYGLPWDYPIDIHIMSRDEFTRVFIRRGKKVLRIA